MSLKKKYTILKKNKYDTEISLFKNNEKNLLNNEKIDSLGIIDVPKNKYWGAVTQRYLKYFKTSFPTQSLELIYMYALLKKYSALVNQQVGSLSIERSNIIQKVCDEIINGELNDNFPLTIWQTGSGTTTNMNLNEVISNRANQLISEKQELNENNYIHPNDHVNRSQSSNDSYPTVLYMLFVFKIITRLQPVLQKVINTLQEKENKFKNIYKIGRTHLQDALPLTFGEEFSGYKSLIQSNLDNILHSIKYCFELPLGGTAVGTGANADKRFGQMFADEINKILISKINNEYDQFINNNLSNNNNFKNIYTNNTDINFVSAPNKFAALSANNPLINLSSSLKELAINLMKIANDIRFMASGPQTGLSEIIIPQNEPGSSIMPGKVNPTQAEVIIMVCIEVISNDLAVSIAGSQGNFELNVCRPLTYYKINESIDLLVEFLINFNDNLLIGIDIDKKKIENNLKKSNIIATLMNHEIGYENVSKIVNYSIKNNKTLEEACIDLNFSQEYDDIIKPILLKNKKDFDEN